MALVTQVTAPARKPRSGGIKDIVDSFIREDRLSITEAIAWSDSGCALPSETSAGCYDANFPLVFDPVVVEDGGITLTFTRVDDTVTVDVAVGAAPDPDGFTAPWAPTEAVNETVGDGSIQIGVDGAVSYAVTPSGTAEFDYATTGRQGGRIPDKVGGGVGIIDGIGAPFAQYAGVKCYLGGDNDGPSFAEQASALLGQGEDRMIEAKLWAWASGASTTLTAADSLTAAIAALEEHADATYVGLPVIILSRSAATLAAAEDALVREGGKLYTPNGVPVLATSAVGDDGQDSVAVIGQPAVYASEARSYTGPQLALNQALGLAERVYAVGVDCEFRATIEVTTP